VKATVVLKILDFYAPPAKARPNSACKEGGRELDSCHMSSVNRHMVHVTRQKSHCGRYPRIWSAAALKSGPIFSMDFATSLQDICGSMAEAASASVSCKAGDINDVLPVMTFT
jgi:hypothetical protein